MLVVLAGAGACTPAASIDHGPVDAASIDQVSVDLRSIVHPRPAGGAAGAEDGSAVYAEILLYSDGVAIDQMGMPQLVPVGTRSRGNLVHRALQDVWLSDGTVPGPDRYGDLAEHALRDLEALLLPDGASIAGASERWRYVWPRDASFVAAALARTGHGGDAHRVLLHLQTLQDRGSTGGVFEARYLPDGTGAVPDQRGPQLDGSGWVLWAVAEWYATAPRGGRRADELEALRPLVTRSVAAIRANVGDTGLPLVSPDYWEVAESTPTLGTLAALLLGVRAVGPVLAALDEPPVADLVHLLQRGVDEHFAPAYARHPGETDRDTAVAFLMPPFAPYDDDVRVAWEEAAASMARPAGGLAPGAGWTPDGVSWTPTTALFALSAAASGDVGRAERWLDWLDAHRTPSGALPEKVLWDGSPAAVAPLAWTCAVVLLTLDALDEDPWRV